MQVDLIGALVVGLLGATHCVAMCGGISAALASATNKPVALVLYSLGRLISYSLFGFIIGGAVASTVAVSGWQQGLMVLRAVAGVMMILIGLYVAGWYRGITKVESLGKGIWKRLSPFATKLLPLPHAGYALPLGMFWGWIPCGLVYSMLSWAAMSGSATSGALTMLAFGVGTLPAMLGLGFFAQQMNRITRSPNVRKMGGILLIVIGLFTLFNLVI